MKSKSENQPGGEILLYQTEDGKTRLEVQFQGETVWLTQKQMAELFQKDVRTISEHIRNVYEEGELIPEPTLRNFRIVQSEGSRRVSRDGERSVATTCKFYLQVREQGGLGKVHQLFGDKLNTIIEELNETLAA